MLSSDLPPIHEYRTNYEIIPRLDWDELTPGERKLLKRKIRERRAVIALALKSGIEDSR